MGKVLLQIIHDTQHLVYTNPELAAPLHKDPKTYASNLASSVGQLVGEEFAGLVLGTEKVFQ